MKLFFLIIGCILISLFFFLVLIYFNLFTLGYTFLEFVYFIISSGIIWLLVIGLIFIYKGMERMIRDELLLRYKGKFSGK